jgi:hypothetical protein
MAPQYTSHLGTRTNHAPNTSGQGQGVDIPPGVAGWSWGALLANCIWGIANNTWVALLTAVPGLGFFVAIYLGVNGRELAWRNKRWDNLEHFNRVQRLWSIWALVICCVLVVVFLLIASALGAAYSRGV